MLELWQAHEQRFTWLKSLPYLGYSNLAALRVTVHLNGTEVVVNEMYFRIKQRHCLGITVVIIFTTFYRPVCIVLIVTPILSSPPFPALPFLSILE